MIRDFGCKIQKRCAYFCSSALLISMSFGHAKKSIHSILSFLIPHFNFKFSFAKEVKVSVVPNNQLFKIICYLSSSTHTLLYVR